MSERNGGPAFPGRQLEEMKNALDGGVHRDWVEYPGMTLRDYLAAKAMQGFLAADPAVGDLGPGEIARLAYQQADAMIASRGETP